MPKLNASYSGTGLALHAKAVQSIIGANAVKSVLEVGTFAEKDRRLFVPDPALLWYGQRTAAADPASLAGLAAPYDMIFANRWVSQFSVADIPAALKALKRLAGKVLFVAEDETTSALTTPQRPRGWDRVDWGNALQGSTFRTHVFAMTVDKEGVSAKPTYMLTGAGMNVWRLIEY